MTETMSVFEMSALAAAMAAAHEGGVLAALASGAAIRRTELAAAVDCDEAALRRVLDVLTAAGLCAREGDVYRIAPAALAEIRAVPGGADRYAGTWAHANEYLRNGVSLHRMAGSTDERGADYVGVVGDLGDMFEDAAAELAARAPLSAGARVLDVGAGSAVWSLAMVRADPDARVTALDLPEVLPNALGRAARLGLAERLRTWAGDYRHVDGPGRFDRVVLANILHLEEPDVAADVVRRAASATAPGGDIVVVDVFDDHAMRHAAYALHLGMRTRTGWPHSLADLTSWLAAAGFGQCRRIALARPAAPVDALVASR